MSTYVYNAGGRYEMATVRHWDPTRSAWEDSRRYNSYGMELQSVFTPYVGTGTIFQRDVSTMPLHPDSAQMANWMWTLTPTPYRDKNGTSSGAYGAKTSLNRSLYGTQPIAACVVDSTDPRCTFQYMDTVTGPNMTTAEVDAILKGPIPWPKGFIPAQNGDRGMAIYDRGTGIMREYFMVQGDVNKPGHWSAGTGGYSLAKPHFEDLPETNYGCRLRAGSSAVVLMHNSLGFIGADEIRSRKINHALSFTTANYTWSNPASYPATWTDGKFPDETWTGWAENGGGAGPYPGDSPCHGQWARLPSTVDPKFNPRTGAQYNPLTQLLIEAAKTYGLFASDTNAWCHAFNCESGNREKMLTGVDPWADNGELYNVLREINYVSNPWDVSDFPWDLTEWAVRDWGRPSPDWLIRTAERESYPHYS